jgi:hypothetical protein
MGAAQAKKEPKQLEYELEDDDSMYSTRRPSSARRYQPPVEPVQHDTLEDIAIRKGAFIQRRASRPSDSTNGITSKAITPPKKKAWLSQWQHSRHFPVVAILVGMLVMAFLVFGLSAFGSWWRVHQDDVTYGRPRTFQLDTVVGHNDSAANPTHFIFINLNRHVEVIELPGGDGTHAHIYLGPVLYGDGQDLTPITGEVRDVNGDGKPDLIVHIQDQRLVFINDGTQFRSLQPGEHVNLQGQ